MLTLRKMASMEPRQRSNLMQNQTKNLSPSTESAIKALMPLYPERRAALIPALFLAQKDAGELSDAVQDRVAALLDIPAPWVREVVTFYPMFHEHKVGKCHIGVCRTLSCAMRGSRTLVQKLEKELNIKAGETTPDGLFTLSTMECLASCGTAPMMMVNERYEENLDWTKVKAIVDRVRQGGAP